MVVTTTNKPPARTGTRDVKAGKSHGRPLERYIATLEMIAASNGSGLALSELARCCGLPLATTYRLIQGLLDADLIIPRPGNGKESVAGPRLFRLLHAGIGDSWLSIKLNGTCFVTQLVGKKIISIARSAPERGLTGKVYPGDVMPPHAAASAKAILASQPDAVVPQILGLREGFKSRTKTELARVREEHFRVRRGSFAICWDEMDIGLGTVASPTMSKARVCNMWPQSLARRIGSGAVLPKRSSRNSEPVIKLRRCLEAGGRDAASRAGRQGGELPHLRMVLKAR